jgi:hypothetical protein
VDVKNCVHTLMSLFHAREFLRIRRVLWGGLVEKMFVMVELNMHVG